MRREEIAALGELAGAAAGGLATQIHQMHGGIAERVWRAVGPGALPVRAIHDRIAERSYAAAAQLARGVVRGASTALSLAQRPDAESVEHTPLGRAAVAALNGVWGDRLAREHNRLALEMTLRAGGRDVPLTPEGLRRAYPHPTGRLAVFIHGLCESDEAWLLGAARHIPYGFRLQAELGYTPLYVRYNTGLHISENGRRLARLLDWGGGGGRGGGTRSSRSATRWGAWSPAAPATTATGAPGARGCATCSRSAHRTWGRRSSRRRTPPATCSRACRRRARCWPRR